MQLPEGAFQKMVRVRLQKKSGEEFDSFEMRSGMNLWVFIRKRGHPIGSACSGVGVCAACAVRVVSQQDDTALSAASDFEKQNLQKHGCGEDQRMACLSRVFGDVTVQADYW